MNILIVDDDEAARRVLEAPLRRWGHSVLSAKDGEEAWQTLQGTSVDVVLTDWMMPLMDGLGLCRAIRDMPLPRYVHVVLCTSKDRKEDFLAGLEAGADDFIVKPIDLVELRVRLRAVERLVRLEQDLSRQNENLHHLNCELTNAHGLIQRNVQAAAAAQLRMLPPALCRHENVGVHWLFLPAQSLAGDMLNYFFADEKHLVFYHIDVSGHGIPAALLSMTVTKMLALESSRCTMPSASPSEERTLALPAEVVSGLNREFQGGDGRYFTMTYGIVNCSSGRVRYCDAGQPRAIHIRRDASLRAIGRGGFPVGLWEPMDYEDQNLSLSTGDRLVFYSDGITECENAKGIAFGQERWMRALGELREAPLADLVEGVKKSLGEWRQGLEFDDDLSLLALEWQCPDSQSSSLAAERSG